MKKVLLTGISGYIAMHCAKELLKRDYHINATVRNLDKVEDIKNALSALSLDVDKIQFFQAEDGIRYCLLSRGLGDVYKRQLRIK